MTNENGSKNFRSKAFLSNLEYFIAVNSQNTKPMTDANRKEYDSNKQDIHYEKKIHDSMILNSITRTDIDDYMFKNTQKSQDFDNPMHKYVDRHITTDDLDFSSIKANNYHSSPNMGLSEGGERNSKTINLNQLKVPVNTKRSSADMETSKPITSTNRPSDGDSTPQFDNTTEFKVKSDFD